MMTDEMSYAFVKPKPLCPRCERNTIDESAWDALSRTDNQTHICNNCGRDEAMEDHFAGFVSPQETWAVNR